MSYQRFTAAFDVAIQTDGKIVAAGTTGTAPSGYISGNRFALARYETDGTLDASFGTAGRVRTGFGSGHGGCGAFGVVDPTRRQDRRRRVCEERVRHRPVQPRWFDSILLRSERETADEGYRRGGGALLRRCGSTRRSDRRGGALSDDDGDHAVLARFLADGSADASFGTGGAAIASDKRSIDGAPS